MDLKDGLIEKSIKMDPEISSDQKTHNKDQDDMLYDTKFNVLEYQTTEQFKHVDEIKQELSECEMPVFEKLQTFPATIKKELENLDYDKVTDISDIKQEVSEYVLQTKSEGELSELLTAQCDLPSLKSEDINFPDKDKTINPSSKNAPKIRLKKKKYVCPICETNFPSSKSRSSHINEHFVKRYAVCQFCGKFMKKDDYFQHSFIHSVKNRINIHIEEKSLKYNRSSEELKQDSIKNVDDISFKCAICFKKPFKCDICPKESTVKCSLRICNSEKPFKCDICSKEFTYKCYLQLHLRIHSGEKPFKCDICSKVFTWKSALREHLKIHSDKKPFKCDICSKEFTRKYHMQTHLMVHSDEKPFKCDICSKEFAEKSNLRRHLRIHSDKKPFKCDICSKEFSEKFGLQRHLRIHSDTKPYKCDICSKEFTEKCNLWQHLQIHSEEKPFNCDICSKKFTSKYKLKRHLRIHTDKKNIQM